MVSYYDDDVTAIVDFFETRINFIRDIYSMFKNFLDIQKNPKKKLSYFFWLKYWDQWPFLNLTSIINPRIDEKHLINDNAEKKLNFVYIYLSITLLGLFINFYFFVLPYCFLQLNEKKVKLERWSL